MKLVRARVLVILAATALALTVSAASAPRPILKLALQRADMPATTKRPLLPSPSLMAADGLGVLGVRGLQGADYAYTWPAGGFVTIPALGRIDKEWRLAGEVFRAPDQAGAKKLFELGKRAETGLVADFSGQPKDLRLPAYGDEQIGRVSTDSPDGVQAMVFVRKGAVVWQIRVVPIPRQFRATKAQVIAVLKTYASKQKARVGGG